MASEESDTGRLANGIDCHVHIFSRDLTLSPVRRYEPDYEATPEALLQTLSGSGLDRALLVQPSFLGTDNTYLLDAISRYPDRFRGVAVVDTSTDRKAMEELADRGVVGVRLNAIGRASPDISSLAYRQLTDLLAELDLFLEIQAENSQWNDMASGLLDLPCTIVIDHFGRTPVNHDSGGFNSLLNIAQTKDIWFKFSAPYRFGEPAARDCARLLLDVVGPERIVWGSDWPWTQFEDRHIYVDCMHWLVDWLGPSEVQNILVHNASKLVRFK
ncbi:MULTISPECIES: amidohydrolase family protein [Agrobacterium]|jgi:predicted TIM-barrel fold metal-dependent hydrolase|uniref:amidohydrolase family protein n=1 Tax=Agrobacterium TaxID=357 RepID=UPI001C6E4F38|nr:MULTISPECIES: amidohydrolase family protein [Agrobacterium]MBW9075018.1 amidohydrolase family protein [Agrobacterium deltaense]MCZ7889605.1 amidohydrolase family protein [Agrobacterium salinitolerans]UNZ54144.1 amidohydrolase family protein [Agrobacterium tumefaciens]